MKKIGYAGLALAVAASISVSAISPAAAEPTVVTPANLQDWVIAIQQGVSGGWDPPSPTPP